MVTLLPSGGIEDLSSDEEEEYRREIDNYNSGDYMVSQAQDFWDDGPKDGEEKKDDEDDKNTTDRRIIGGKDKTLKDA